MNEISILVGNKKRILKIKSEIKEFSNIFKLTTKLDKESPVITSIEYNRVIDEDGYIVESEISKLIAKIIK